MKKDIFLLIFILIPLPSWGAKPLSDGEVRDLIISGNISTYTSPCPCPYSFDYSKNKCGENSAYTNYPGQMKCYPGDISDEEVRQYRQAHQIEAPKLPWVKDEQKGY